MLKIVVCVKQVPEIEDVQVNPETGTLRREGVAAILNPFCEYALDHAVRLKTACSSIAGARIAPEKESSRQDRVIQAVTMGPPQARAALLRALELGADQALLLSDRKFAGSDTWATALTLAQAIRRTIPDYGLILVGKQAIDGDTAQVGPELAEILGIPQILYGVSAELTPDLKSVRVKRETESGYEIVAARLPALVSFSKGETIRRMPSFPDVLAARGKPLRVMNADELGLDASDVGLAGSLTQVVQIFPPPPRTDGIKIEDLEPSAAARRMAQFLLEKGLLKARAVDECTVPTLKE